jgi:hypothetical protein
MKGFIALLVLGCFVSVSGLAQDARVEKKDEMKKEATKAEVMKEMKGEAKWHGYIVDAMCANNMLKKGNAMEKAAKHTKECALEEACAASGFGVFSDGKYYKFDEKGDKLAKEMIEKSATEKGLMADVFGSMKDDKIMVASLAEMKMEHKEMGKKAGDAKKMEEHKH